jgi:hypothetical protein
MVDIHGFRLDLRELYRVACFLGENNDASIHRFKYKTVIKMTIFGIIWLE